MTHGNGAAKIMCGLSAIWLDVQNFIKWPPRAAKISKAEAIRSVLNGLRTAAAGGDAALNQQPTLLFGAQQKTKLTVS